MTLVCRTDADKTTGINPISEAAFAAYDCAMKIAQMIAAVALSAAALLPQMAVAQGDTAASLRAKYAELQPKLNDNNFQKPIYLESSESANKAVVGDVYAVLDYPFGTAAPALSEAGNWCDILLLPANTKYCRASGGGQGSVLDVRIGRKPDQPVEQAYQLKFSHQVAAQTSSYMKVVLSANQGPLGTKNYRIVLDAVPIEKDRTFIHLTYSYETGAMGRMAMQMYLGTAGKNKVGFTITGQDGGQPAYVDGMRGVVERNSMRYYLAIEAFLGALSAPQEARLDKRLRDWFAATERYPRQLHEMDQASYLELKRNDYRRQQAGPLASDARGPARS